jgi:glycerate kinase
LVRAALDKGANRIIIAMGGSATVDGGCGILNALVINFLDTEGNQLKAVPQELIGVDRIDISGLDERITVTEIVILCDVSNNLLGPQGAAAVYGPQKGASAADVEFLDTFLENFVAVTSAQTGQNIDEIKYGGAAGGASAGLYAWLGAKLVNGIDYFLTLTDFDKALNRADLVITGEGSIDNQTLQGKGPYGVAVRAKAKGIPVIGLGGKVEPGKEMEDYFDELICINPESVDIDVAMKNTKTNLIKTAKMIGDRMTLIN